MTSLRVGSSRAAAPRLAALVAAALLATACSRAPRAATQRIAILAVDNLTGDAAFDWVAGAAPRIVASELTGSTGTTPLLAATVADAYAEGATRFLHGYFECHVGQASACRLHFQFLLEDAATHKMQTPITLDGDPLQVTAKLAHDIDPSAHAFSSSNTQAIEAFGRGEYQHALDLDPDFSAAWLAWVESLARTDGAQAADVASRALARPGLRSAADRSRIQLLAASLTHDPEAELQALESLSGATPADPNTARGLAEAAMNAREFSRAAKYFETLLRLAPGDASAQNLLGYAYAFAGDLNSAMKAFDLYRHQPGQEPNALDSMAEAYFVNGRFAEAEKLFLEAHQKDPSMLAGGDLLKAAYAHYLAGDPVGADPISQRYLQFRADARDPLLAWKTAAWLFSTGRPERARSGLESALATASPQLAELARKQLAVWKGPDPFSHDLALLKRTYQSTPPSSDGLARTFYAEALLAAGQTAEARKLVALWPLPDVAGDAVLQAYLYPKFLELREKLK